MKKYAYEITRWLVALLGLFIIYWIYTSPTVSNNCPQILMMCSAPWEWCVPYTEPKEINHIIRQSYLEE